MSDDIPDAVEQRPWQPSDGPRPSVHAYPHRQQPAMQIRRDGEWCPGRAIGRQHWTGGFFVYQVEVNAGLGVSIIRTYRWPQPGLRLAPEPQDGEGGAGGETGERDGEDSATPRPGAVPDEASTE